nr:unnamed protein product [Spirometra erinaceieuropaei]
MERLSQSSQLRDVSDFRALTEKPPEISVKERLLVSLLENYRRYERPTEGLQSPTVVHVAIKILAITSVDVINMQYTADMILVQTWTDPRLKWENSATFGDFKDNLLLTAKHDELWIPDLFFRNGKEGFMYRMTMPNYMIRVNPSGRVIYSQKITMNLACQMYLRNFPMDRQYCDMDIGSYGYTIDQLKFVWDESRPLVFADDMQISEFNTPTETFTEDCTVPGTTSTGTYSCLLGKFQLRRQIGSYLVGTYIPAFLIVIVSWLTFWVNTDAIPARVTLGLLTLISLLTKGASLDSTLPRVSYIKAIDVWLIACLLFVIAAMLEFTLASYWSRRVSQRRWRSEVRESVRSLLARVICPCQSPSPNQVLLRCGCCGVAMSPHEVVASQQQSAQHRPQYAECYCYARCQCSPVETACRSVKFDIPKNRPCSAQKRSYEKRLAQNFCSGDCSTVSWTHEEPKSHETHTRRRRQGDNKKHRHKSARYNSSSSSVTVSPLDCPNRLPASPKRRHMECSDDHLPPPRASRLANSGGADDTGTVLFHMSSLKKGATGRKKHSVKFSKDNHQQESQKQLEQQQQQPLLGRSSDAYDNTTDFTNRHKPPVPPCQRETATRERLASLEVSLEDRPVDIESEIDAYSRFLFPCCFVLYNCCYWLFYLIISDPGFINS